MELRLYNGIYYEYSIVLYSFFFNSWQFKISFFRYPSVPITTTCFRCKKKYNLKDRSLFGNDTNFRFLNGNFHYCPKFIVKLGLYISTYLFYFYSFFDVPRSIFVLPLLLLKVYRDEYAKTLSISPIISTPSTIILHSNF